MTSVVLITGATGGLGQALAKIYAKPGTRLALFGRNPVKLTQLRDACVKQGGDAETFAMDVSDQIRMNDAILEFDRQHGVTLAIANVAISPATARTLEKIRDVEAINVQGTLNTILPLIEPMRARRCGQIAVIGSLGARIGIASSPAYSMSKAAIETLAFGLRSSLRPRGVKVNVVSPGFFVSPMSARVRGPKPFAMSADRAALIIQKGLVKDKARISFPFPLAVVASLLSALPYDLAEKLMRPFSFEMDD